MRHMGCATTDGRHPILLSFTIGIRMSRGSSHNHAESCSSDSARSSLPREREPESPPLRVPHEMVTGPDPDHREPRTFQGGNDLFTSESRQLAHGPTVTRWIPTKSSGSAACQLMRYAEQPQQSAPRPLAAAS